MGQVMSAFFQQQPLIRPLPAQEGFSVDATAFINSSFTVSANFALESGESSSSTSMSSPTSPVISITSIPLIKVCPVDDEDYFRDCFPIEPGSGVARALPIFGYNSCSGYAEDGFENEFEANISQDLSLATSSLGEQQLTRPLLGEAITLYSDFNGLIISHPSILSLVLDDYSEEGITQYGTADKDEDNTSLSTLDSTGPQTPPRSSSPALSDLEAEGAFDDALNEAPTSMWRRSGLASLDLRSLYDRHATSDSILDINSPLYTSPSTSFVAGKTETGCWQEPLTPVTVGFPGKQDRTPTHTRTPLANPLRLSTPAKIRSRIGAGKENIAPLTLQFRRG